MNHITVLVGEKQSKFRFLSKNIKVEVIINGRIKNNR